MCVRLVHLLDEQKRKELMIIYGEDLAPTGFTAADLKKGGKAFDQWPTIEKRLVERAKKKIKIPDEAPVIRTTFWLDLSTLTRPLGLPPFNYN